MRKGLSFIYIDFQVFAENYEIKIVDRFKNGKCRLNNIPYNNAHVFSNVCLLKVDI